ncbi:MAG: dynamin family protein [Micrococcaceae bacterium]
MARSSVSYAERFEALEKATDLAQGRLPDALINESRSLIQRSSERRQYSADHTVVAFIGATGSGKSSLLNAIAGQKIARSAHTRPTTSEPLAIMWDSAGSESLLNWLGVKERHEMPPDPQMSGLILLDLPDFDSTSEYNRQVVDKLVGMVDVLVWVMDPQKYADAAIHQNYIQPWANEDAVTIAVLNQVDKIRPEERQGVIESVEHVMRLDGLKDVHVLPVSAYTGEGIAQLKHEFSMIAQAHKGAVERWNLDARTMSQKLQRASGNSKKVNINDKARARLAANLAQSAGIEGITGAVRRSYERGSSLKTGWPVTRWVQKMRPDPLKALGLEKPTVSPELVRSSAVMTPVQKANAHNAIRNFVDESAQGASEPWRNSIRRAGTVDERQLTDALDQAIVRTQISREKDPKWWSFINVLQYFALAVTFVGLVWLVAITAVNFFGLSELLVPKIENVPIPTIVFFGGIILSLILALFSRIAAASGAKRQAAKVRKRFEKSIQDATQSTVITPIQHEIDRFHQFGYSADIASSK